MKRSFKLSLEMPLSELLKNCKESKDILFEFGLKEYQDILDVISPKLSLSGAFKLLELSEEEISEVWTRLQKSCYRGGKSYG